MDISIIIPTLNEARNLPKLFARLQKVTIGELVEIIVVDAQSTDATRKIAEQAGARVIRSPKRSRAAQMNLGARSAKGTVLYFLHADTLPPQYFDQAILGAIKDGCPVGCFRYRFDGGPLLLHINAFFTRFPMLWCRGGDQSLYILSGLFKKTGGFREDHVIMEDFEFISRIRKEHRFKIIPKNMIVSARKYEENSYLKVQWANLLVFNMYRLGYPQEELVATYRRLLHGIKNENALPDSAM